MIQIYYGFGKGKTTAAIGQGMRAKGAGNTVTLVQFLKDNKSSELSVLPFDIFNAPDTLPFNPGKEYQAWVDSAIDYIMSSKSNMISSMNFSTFLIRLFRLTKHLVFLICSTAGKLLSQVIRKLKSFLKKQTI